MRRRGNKLVLCGSLLLLLGALLPLWQAPPYAAETQLSTELEPQLRALQLAVGAETRELEALATVLADRLPATETLTAQRATTDLNAVATSIQPGQFLALISDTGTLLASGEKLAGRPALQTLTPSVAGTLSELMLGWRQEQSGWLDAGAGLALVALVPAGKATAVCGQRADAAWLSRLAQNAGLQVELRGLEAQPAAGGSVESVSLLGQPVSVYWSDGYRGEALVPLTGVSGGTLAHYVFPVTRTAAAAPAGVPGAPAGGGASNLSAWLLAVVCILLAGLLVVAVLLGRLYGRLDRPQSVLSQLVAQRQAPPAAADARATSAELQLLQRTLDSTLAEFRAELRGGVQPPAQPATVPSAVPAVAAMPVAAVVSPAPVAEAHKPEHDGGENGERFRRMIELAQEGIIAVDEKEVITFANTAFAASLGYASSELVGMSIFELCDEVTAKLILAQTERRRSGEVGTYEVQLISRNGELRDVLLTASPLFDRFENFEGSLAVCMDVTDRKRSDQALLYSQKMESLGALAGGVAHDFNNLLVGIMGNVDLALSEIHSGSPAYRHLLDVRKASQRAADLVQQMLAYSGKGRFIVEPLDVSALVQDMRGLLEAALPKHVNLRLNLKPALPLISADKAQVRQAAMNLIFNAAEAIGQQPGAVRVATGMLTADASFLAGAVPSEGLEPGQYAYVEVSDTGPGIPEEIRARIFDPFFSTKFAGRGLGLAAVLGIMRGHGGAIKVYSDPGEGSNFKLLFPVVATTTLAPPPTAPVQENQVYTAWRGRGTILVIDDEPAARAMARRILTQRGFEVLVASDGIDGLQVYRDNLERIVAVVLDLNMPRMGGEEVFPEIRQLSKDVYIILSSGYNEEEVMERFNGRGPTAFIQKPYLPAALAQKLHDVLGPELIEHPEPLNTV